MDERWMPVPNFPGYEISTLGRLLSHPKTFHRTEWRYNRPVTVVTKGGILKGWLHMRGSQPLSVMMALVKDGRKYETRLHRIVLEAFVGPCPEGCEGCHNDGNPLNNRLDNLRWDTHLSNTKDMVRHGTRVNPPTHWGIKHHNARLTDAQILAIRSTTPIRRGTKTALARKYKTTSTTIARILSGATRAYEPQNSAPHQS